MIMPHPDRQTLLTQCRQSLESRKAEYARESASLDQAAAGETKSSAGDKYETGREMIAQARNLIQRNLAETLANLEALDRMAAAPLRDRIGFGSLVETSGGWYWVGISLGEVEIPGGPVRTVSLASPLGAALKGKGVGDTLPWKSAVLEILGLPR